MPVENQVVSDQIAIAKRIIRRQRAGDPDIDEDAARLAELVLEEHEEEA